MDNNCDADARTGVGVGVGVDDMERLRDGLMECWAGELHSPPGEIVDEVPHGVMWHERTCTGDAEHSFHGGKVGSTVWYHETGVKQLP